MKLTLMWRTNSRGRLCTPNNRGAHTSRRNERIEVVGRRWITVIPCRFIQIERREFGTHKNGRLIARIIGGVSLAFGIAAGSMSRPTRASGQSEGDECSL